VVFLSSLSLGYLTGILISFVAALGTDVFDMEKPVVFTYEEIFLQLTGSLSQVFLDMEHMALCTIPSFVTRFAAVYFYLV
jgi:hypothetical protein